MLSKNKKLLLFSSYFVVLLGCFSQCALAGSDVQSSQAGAAEKAPENAQKGETSSDASASKDSNVATTKTGDAKNATENVQKVETSSDASASKDSDVATTKTGDAKNATDNGPKVEASSDASIYNKNVNNVRKVEASSDASIYNKNVNNMPNNQVILDALNKGDPAKSAASIYNKNVNVNNMPNNNATSQSNGDQTATTSSTESSAGRQTGAVQATPDATKVVETSTKEKTNETPDATANKVVETSKGGTSADKIVETSKEEAPTTIDPNIANQLLSEINFKEDAKQKGVQDNVANKNIGTNRQATPQVILDALNKSDPAKAAATPANGQTCTPSAAPDGNTDKIAGGPSPDSSTSASTTTTGVSSKEGTKGKDTTPPAPGTPPVVSPSGCNPAPSSKPSAADDPSSTGTSVPSSKPSATDPSGCNPVPSSKPSAADPSDKEEAKATSATPNTTPPVTPSGEDTGKRQIVVRISGTGVQSPQAPQPEEHNVKNNGISRSCRTQDGKTINIIVFVGKNQGSISGMNKSK
ncbi:MAG: hypothetical protein LBF72_02700 [Holosporales bacterium]|jgi:hypothetical protein|nr:hypothetical protein [Holosporales bacterium]